MPNPKKPQLSRKDLALAYKKVFGGSVGEVVLDDLAKTAHVASTTFVPGDIYHTILNEGMRNLYNRIQYYLTVDPSTLEEPNARPKF